MTYVCYTFKVTKTSRGYEESLVEHFVSKRPPKNFSEIGRQNLAKLEQNEKLISLISADALVMTVGFFAVVCSYASLYANNLRPPQKKIAMVCILA